MEVVVVNLFWIDVKNKNVNRENMTNYLEIILKCTS